MRLDGYVRVSRVGGRAGPSFISPDVQRDRLDGWARAHGHVLATVHEDLDEPGSRVERPGLQAALARIEAGATDGLVVAALDRFARSITGAVTLMERIEAAGGVLVSVRESFDTSTPIGRFARSMMLAVAELELDHRREGWATARRHAVARGIHIASRVPTGYRRQADRRLAPDPDMGPVIRDVFERRARGDGWRTLARLLDATGVRGPYGNETWTEGAVQKMIRNRVYLGEARSGEFVNAAAHAPLVSPSVWAAAQHRDVLPRARAGDGLLLSGLIRCAGCRYRLKADSMRDRDGSRLGLYRCRVRHAAGHCPAPAAVLARLVDPHVERAFLRELEEDGLVAQATLDEGRVEAAMLRADAARADLTAYRDSDALAILGRRLFEEGLEARAKVLEDANREVGEALRHSGRLPDGLTPGALAAAWPTLPVGERREILAGVIGTVFVRKTRGQGRAVAVADRTLILWRGLEPDDLPARGRRGPLASFAWPDERPGDVGMAGA